MKTLPPRIPEGGAIEDSQDLNMERYSEIMKKALGQEYRRFVAHIVQQVQPPQGATVLEIGPGPGWVGIWLAKERKDLRLDGLEASPDMCRVATANAQTEGVAERVRYVQGVVENMSGIADHTYDLVISRDSLHHWDDPLKGFQEIIRVLKPDGKVYISDNRRDLSFVAKLIVNIVGPLMVGKMAKYWKSSIAASYTPEELQQMLQHLPEVKWTIRAELLDIAIQSVK
jgi:ubiquinone/menaquinone biosynthesis C-methylase UbiE